MNENDIDGYMLAAQGALESGDLKTFVECAVFLLKGHMKNTNRVADATEELVRIENSRGS